MWRRRGTRGPEPIRERQEGRRVSRAAVVAGTAVPSGGVLRMRTIARTHVRRNRRAGVRYVSKGSGGWEQLW